MRKNIILMACSILLGLLLIETGLRAAGFVYLSLQKYRNRQNLAKKGAFRIIALGCSNTALGGKYSYPSQLESILNQKGLGVKFTVLNLGVPGMHSGSITAQLERNLEEYKPDLVCVMMGINDVGNLIPYKYTPDAWTVQFLRSLRIYKLSKALWFRIVNKAKECGFMHSKIEGKNPFPIGRERELENAIKNDPKSGWAHLDMGIWCLGIKDTQRAREMVEKALELEPQNKWIRDWANFILGFTEKPGNKEIAESRLKEIIKTDPLNSWSYVQLGWWYRSNGRYAEFEEMYKKAIEIDPRNAWPYLDLARYYKSHGERDKANAMFKKAVDAFKQAIDMDRGLAWPYMEMGWWYNDFGDNGNAEAMLNRKIGQNPQDEWAYVELMKFYREQGKYDKVREMFKKATANDDKNVWAYYELSKTLRCQGKYKEAAEMIQRGLSINSVKDALYSGLAMCYQELGDFKLAEDSFRKAQALRLKNFNPMTRYNYCLLKKIIIQKGIKLVAIQYPMRSVELLKRMFNDKEGIAFVDNEESFKEAVKRDSYEDYFVNNFAGDFGHCTPKGNRLIAQNVADVIMKEYFK